MTPLHENNTEMLCTLDIQPIFHNDDNEDKPLMF